MIDDIAGKEKYVSMKRPAEDRTSSGRFVKIFKRSSNGQKSSTCQQLWNNVQNKRVLNY